MMHVIIATRDRAPLVASTLEALATQAWPGRPFDILSVVDSGSTDETSVVIVNSVRCGIARFATPANQTRAARVGAIFTQQFDCATLGHIRLAWFAACIRSRWTSNDPGPRAAVQSAVINRN
jgi:hypothetical protein